MFVLADEDDDLQYLRLRLASFLAPLLPAAWRKGEISFQSHSKILLSARFQWRGIFPKFLDISTTPYSPVYQSCMSAWKWKSRWTTSFLSKSPLFKSFDMLGFSRFLSTYVHSYKIGNWMDWTFIPFEFIGADHECQFFRHISKIWRIHGCKIA